MWLFQRIKIPSTAATSGATLKYLQHLYIRSRLKERGEKKRQISGIAYARGKGVAHSGNLIWNKHCHEWLQSVITKGHWMNTIPRPSFLVAKEVISAKMAAWLASCSICSLTLNVIVVSTIATPVRSELSGRLCGQYDLKSNSVDKTTCFWAKKAQFWAPLGWFFCHFSSRINILLYWDKI